VLSSHDPQAWSSPLSAAPSATSILLPRRRLSPLVGCASDSRCSIVVCIPVGSISGHGFTGAVVQPFFVPGDLSNYALQLAISVTKDLHVFPPTVFGISGCPRPSLCHAPTLLESLGDSLSPQLGRPGIPNLSACEKTTRPHDAEMTTQNEKLTSRILGGIYIWSIQPRTLFWSTVSY
jgi:hypothetical protein